MIGKDTLRLQGARAAALVLTTAAFCGACVKQPGSEAGVDLIPGLEVPSASTVPSALDIRLSRDGLDRLIKDLLPQLLDSAGTGAEGLSTFDLGALGEEGFSYPIDLGPFQGGVTVRDAQIALDLRKIVIETLPSSGPLRLRVRAEDLPIRILHAVVVGDVSLFGMNTNAACILSTEAPDFSAIVDLDATIAIEVGEDGAPAVAVEIQSFDARDIHTVFTQDCGLPECQDQSGAEDPCLECEACGLLDLGPQLIEQIRGLLGGLFTDLLRAWIQDVVASQSSVLGAVLGGGGLRVEPRPLLRGLAPALDPLARGLRALDLTFQPEAGGVSSVDGVLDLRLALGLRAPQDGCGRDRPPLPAVEDLPRLEWPGTVPAGAEGLPGGAQPYDLAIRLRLDLLERLVDELLRSGLACSTLRLADLGALLGVEISLQQGGIQLLFPSRRGLGDPELPLRLRILVDPGVGPILKLGLLPSEEGPLRMGIELDGVEILVTPDGPEGPTWLALRPRLALDLDLRVEGDGALLLAISSLRIDGLGDATTVATEGFATDRLLEGIEALVSALAEIPPLRLDLAPLWQGLLPGARLRRLRGVGGARVEAYLRLAEPDPPGAPAAAPVLEPGTRRSAPRTPPSPALLWISLGLAAAILLVRRAGMPPAFLATAGILGIAVAASPACDPSDQRFACTIHADCGLGFRCGDDGYCMLAQPCSEHADCCAGAICSGGLCIAERPCVSGGCAVPGARCVQDTCLPSPCSTDRALCPTGSACWQGACLPPGRRLSCPATQAADPAAGRCITLPRGCADLKCPAGLQPTVLDGPLAGIRCGLSEARCACAPRPAQDPAEPDGSIAAVPGATLWYDARYGDLVRGPDPGGGAMALTSSHAALGVLAGLPPDRVATHDPAGWRGGVAARGPDLGRALNVLHLDDGRSLLAFLEQPGRALRVAELDEAGLLRPRLRLDEGAVLGGPVLHLGRLGRPCVAFLKATAISAGENLLSLVRLCAPTFSGEGTWSEEAAAPLRSPPEGCLEARECLPQDLGPLARAPRVLAVSQGPGAVVALTADVAPTTAVAARWIGEALQRVELEELPAAGGRGMLAGAVQRKGKSVYILLAADAPRSLHLYRWDDGAEAPEPVGEQADLRAGAPDRARWILAGPSRDGAPTWLVRTEPRDALLWITREEGSWKTLAELDGGPVLGAAWAGLRSVVGWRLRPGSPEPELRVWNLP